MARMANIKRVLDRWSKPAMVGVLTTSLTLSGCAGPQAVVEYWGPAQNQFYKSVATEIDHPALVTESPESVTFTEPPKTVADQRPTDVWDLSLSEAIQIALSNSDVIRTNGTFLAGGGILNNVNGVTSVYDPAIQETSIQLGQGGIESALAAFDANFASTMFWSRDESIRNFGGLTVPSTTEAGNFNATLSKVFGTGATLALGHTVDYTGISGGLGGLGGGGLPSTYSGNTAVQFRQPLLAGSGTEFTRIAGPTASATSSLSGVTSGFFGGGAASGAASGLSQQLSGVSNGVVIARINSDISITQFESSIRDMIRDVENIYWDLYLAYRNFDTATAQRNSAYDTWRVTKERVRYDSNVYPDEEAQATDQYFTSVAQVDTARSAIFEVETRLRRLLGLPVSDGRVIRPLDSPVTAKVLPDWYSCLEEALSERPELRAHKWQVKSLQLQLKAAQSLTRPSLDVVAGYQINGFGDQLLGYDNPGAIGSADGPTFYESQTDGDLTSWQLGVAMSTPIGLRRARSQKRNLELRLAKAQKALAAAEHEISQELANGFQELARTQANMESQYSRRAAAIKNAELLRIRDSQGNIASDILLRAQARRATAENDFFRAVVDYNKALANLEYRKGTLLEYDNVILSEGPWTQHAHYWADRRSEERAHAKPARWTQTSPAPFASNFNVDPVELARPAYSDTTVDPTWASEENLPPIPENASPVPAEIPFPETQEPSGMDATVVEPPAIDAVLLAPAKESSRSGEATISRTDQQKTQQPRVAQPSRGIQQVGNETSVLQPMNADSDEAGQAGGVRRAWFIE